MADQYRFLFNNLAWERGCVVSTNVSAGQSPAGFKLAQATDMRPGSVWKVLSAHSTEVQIEFTRRSSPPTIARPFGIGFAGHNLGTAGATYLLVEHFSGGAWSEIGDSAVGNLGDDNRIWLDTSTAIGAIERVRIRIFFDGGGGPSADLTIGEVYFGEWFTVTEPSEAPTAPERARRVAFSDRYRTAAGGRFAFARSHRERSRDVIFEHIGQTLYDELVALWEAQEGPTFPWMMHGHHHRDGLAWVEGAPDMSNTGGADYVTFDADELGEIEIEDGCFGVQLPVLAHEVIVP